jgi:REP element-mobilizing transposase RayT
MIIAYHLVWTTYGTWLPNDPRGSGSRSVAASALEDLGQRHYGRRKIQPPPTKVRVFYDRAEPRLQFPVIRFDLDQIQQVGAAFGGCIEQFEYTCYAAAILPDHAHLVIRKHRDSAEQMIENLQQSTRLRISADQITPDGHPLWTKGGWRGFLDSVERVETVIRYIQRNPARAAIPAQHWDFVRPYDRWPFRNRPQ